jgi:nucleoside-diphosphate-sugar epimerase
MRVFVTGATGWVGSAVTNDLIAAGHQVLGLTRSEQGAQALAKAGAEIHRGDLSDLASLRAGAAQADGIVHTAFNHDFANFQASCDEDQRAIEALGAAIEGTTKPLLVSSGVALLTPGRVCTEADTQPADSHFPRKSEVAVRALAARGINATAIRLAPSVHGHGDQGFMSIVIAAAREKGVSAYIGEGQNRWPGVHRLDAARVYRLALEHNGAHGPFHAVAEEGIPFRAIADIIGRRLNIPVVSISPEEAGAHFGWFAMFAGIDAPASSARTRATLGWEPTHPGLLADIDHPAYFK